MSGPEQKPIDKSTWGPGPWQEEPDRVEWKHAGFVCLMLRSHSGGNWCGYVGVPPGHPLHGKGYSDPHPNPVDALDVHGGITYANSCAGNICHVPAPGEPDDVWWLGFDCNHAWDIAPKSEAYWREQDPDNPFRAQPDQVYRALPYVKRQVEQLAEQMRERAP